MSRAVAEWLEWPKPRRGKVPASFARYQERLKRILGPSKPGKKVHRLPPTAVQLAREGHETPEFKKLVSDLFGNRLEEGLLYEPTNTLALLLYRSGYYHAFIAGESTRPYRQRIADRIQFGERERLSMWLLGGCEFPRSFRILDFSVESFTDEQLMRSGPDRRIYKDASILRSGDQEGKKKRWWLVLRDEVANGWVGKQEWDEVEKAKWEEAAPEREKEKAEIDALLHKYELRKKTRTTAGEKDR